MKTVEIPETFAPEQIRSGPKIQQNPLRATRIWLALRTRPGLPEARQNPPGQDGYSEKVNDPL